MKVTEDVRTKQQVFDEHDALIRIVLPVKAHKYTHQQSLA